MSEAAAPPLPVPPANRLAGRRILITGAGSGIGRVTAELFAAEGATLALLDRNFATVSATAASTGGEAIEADVTNDEAVRRAVAAAGAAMGGIDGVVNSAGIVSFAPFEETDARTWRQVMDINLTGPYLVCHAALPWLRRAAQATIVNLSSGSALLPRPTGSAYAASKGGLSMFTKSLAMELAPRIRANAVCPGAVETPMVLEVGHSAAVLETLRNSYALKRIATPLEVARAILFLTGPESSFITGVDLAVDGGRAFH
jgi:NAD(P)-dependent dehydrogenase (short-subunit alcohol dehydrogenase family)